MVPMEVDINEMVDINSIGQRPLDADSLYSEEPAQKLRKVFQSRQELSVTAQIKENLIDTLSTITVKQIEVTAALTQFFVEVVILAICDRTMVRNPNGLFDFMIEVS